MINETRRNNLIKKLDAQLPKGCRVIAHVREYGGERSKTLGYSIEMGGFRTAKAVALAVRRLVKVRMGKTN